MQTVIKEREYKGTIDPRQHWMDEIKRYENDESEAAKCWVKVCQGHLTKLNTKGK